MNKKVIGIDLGGTKIEVCLLDDKKNMLARERVLSPISYGPKKVAEDTLNLIKRVADGRNFEAVGMGTGGTYDIENDILHGLPHSPVYETSGFLGLLRNKLSVPLIIENDANCLALAEFFETCEGKYTYVMAVILGTGMGSGLILDNKLYKGPNGGAGEIGHNTIDYKGRLCECGRKGCAEAYLSGPSHSRRFYELTGKKIEMPGLYKLYEEGDKQIIDFFIDSCRMMAGIFANAINTLDLQAIILGGGVSNLPIWYKELGPLIKKSLFGPPREEIPIIKARLGDSAGVYGAAYLALREIGAMEF